MNKIITINILEALNKANKALAELKGIAKKLPNQSMLVNTIALREAKASSEIENIFTTDEELYQSLTIKETELKGGAKEVLFYRQALWTGYNDIIEKKTVDLDVIRKTYQKIKQINDGIRPHQTETVIMKRGSGLLGGSVVYTPPRGIEIIKAKLDNLFEFINDDEKYPYDPLIKIAIAHYQLEAIHPFRDGNGRVGRILNILIMIQKQLLEVPILYLSAYVIRNKEDYYYLLNKVTATDIWEKWIIFMLQVIEETSLYTINKIEAIDRLFFNTYDLIKRRYLILEKKPLKGFLNNPIQVLKNNG